MRLPVPGCRRSSLRERGRAGSGNGQLAGSRFMSSRAAAARCDVALRPAGCTTSIDAQIRRTGVPYLHPEEPTVQLDLLGSARVIEWQEAQSRVPVRQRRLLVGAAAPLRPLRNHRHRPADREAEGDGARQFRDCLRLGHAGDGGGLRRAVGAGHARRADAAGLQQDPQLPRMDGRAHRRVGHHRRRWRSSGAGRGDPSEHPLCLRGDLYQSAGARTGLRPAARGDRTRRAPRRRR